MAVMTAAMLATALLPTRDQIGSAAGVLLLLLRCVRQRKKRLAAPWEHSGSCPGSAASHPHFRPRRHLIPASDCRAEMAIRFAIWDQATSAPDKPTAG